MATVPQLSIVMPAYNEGANIEACVTEWHDTVISRLPGSELIVVDDCSDDDTGARLAALAERLPALRPLRTPVNAGHGPAVRLGLDQCRGTFVFQTDSDRQHTPDDFWHLWALRHDATFVFGVRERRADGSVRRIISLVLRSVNAAIWGRAIRDANCPFKLMRRDALNALLAAIPPDGFAPMVMVSVLARHHQYAVREVPIRHFVRPAGTPSLTGVLTWMRVGTRCTREMLALRLAVGRHDSAPASDTP